MLKGSSGAYSELQGTPGQGCGQGSRGLQVRGAGRAMYRGLQVRGAVRAPWAAGQGAVRAPGGYRSGVQSARGGWKVRGVIKVTGATVRDGVRSEVPPPAKKRCKG